MTTTLLNFNVPASPITLSPTSNSWIPNQIKYMVFYNSTSFPIQVVTTNGAKLIFPNNVDYVETDGQTVSIGGYSLANVLGTNNSVLYPSVGLQNLYLGAITIMLYDYSEDEPTGFPYTLPSTAIQENTLLFSHNMGIIPGTIIIPVTPGATINFAFTGVFSAIGYNSGIQYVLGSTSSGVQVGPDQFLVLVGGFGTVTQSSSAEVFAVNVPQPALGAGFFYTLPVPLRLVAGSMNYVTTVANNQYPLIYIQLPNIAGVTYWIPLAISGQAVGTVVYYLNTGGIILPFSIPATLGGVVRWFAGVDTPMLPAGTIIVGGAGNQMASDQWENIILVFSVD